MTIQTDPQYKLRMPPELHAKIKRAAEKNHRSMNAEMVARLDESFAGREALLGSLGVSGEVEARDAIEVLAKAQKIIEYIERNKIEGGL